MAASSVTVTSSATQIVSKSRSSKAARIGLLIRNFSDHTVFLGEISTITADDGYPLDSGDEIIMDFDGNKSQYFFRGDVYGVTTGPNADIRVWELLETR